MLDIPDSKEKISRIPDSGLPYMGRLSVPSCSLALAFPTRRYDSGHTYNYSCNFKKHIFSKVAKVIQKGFCAESRAATQFANNECKCPIDL